MKRMTSFCCDPQTQSDFEEKQIMNDFKRLHDFLNEEEKNRRAALRKQTRQKIRRTNLIADTTEDIFLLSDSKANRRFRVNKRITGVNIRSHDRFNS